MAGVLMEMDARKIGIFGDFFFAISFVLANNFSDLNLPT